MSLSIYVYHCVVAYYTPKALLVPLAIDTLGLLMTDTLDL